MNENDSARARLSEASTAFARTKSWAIEQALPLWASEGHDKARGGIQERLTADGRAITDVPRRAMVQARQTFVYAQAHLLGWHEGRALASEAIELLLTRFKGADGRPGFVHSLAADGSIANPARDTYAHAFILFALGWYYRLTKDSQALAEADDLLAFLDAHASSRHGGFLDEAGPQGGTRGQNPHMHLFEAMISLYAASGEARYLARGAEIFGLFTSRFFDLATGSLIEHFDPALVPLTDARGGLREPGHHFEWIWLLRHFQRHSGRNVDVFADALYLHADRYGWDAGGFIVDEVEAGGRVAKASRRCWPHTECIKANLVEAEAGREGTGERARRAFDRLLETYLVAGRPGGWREHFDADGNLMVNFMPASSFYHIFCAIAEAERVFGASK